MDKEVKCPDCGWEGYESDLLRIVTYKATYYDPEEAENVCPMCKSPDWEEITEKENV